MAQVRHGFPLWQSGYNTHLLIVQILQSKIKTMQDPLFGRMCSDN
jgi:hypothetical protein